MSENKMSLQVTGKNIKVGESFQGYVSDKLDDAVGKYIGDYLAGHVRVEKERGRFITNCSVRVRTGLLLESSGEGTDAYSSADAAFEHLEKRLRRYKRRLKNRHHGVTNGAQETEPGAEMDADGGVEINDFVVEVPDLAATATVQGTDSPLIVAETARTLHRLPVSEAVMRLDLTEEPFLVFRNAGSGDVNVVYRRTDGNIGWIDPSSEAAFDGAKGGGAEAAKRPGKPPGSKLTGSKLTGSKVSGRAGVNRPKRPV